MALPLETEGEQEMKTSQCRRLLKSKEEELRKLLGARDGVTISERMPDIMDEVASSVDRDLVIDSLVREAVLLKQVQAALERMNNGDYGICVACGEVIPERRLRVLPWASMCLQCQEAADQNPGNTDETNQPMTFRWAA